MRIWGRRTEGWATRLCYRGSDMELSSLLRYLVEATPRKSIEGRSRLSSEPVLPRHPPHGNTGVAKSLAMHGITMKCQSLYVPMGGVYSHRGIVKQKRRP